MKNKKQTSYGSLERGPKEEPVCCPEKTCGWKILGKNEIVIEKKSFQIITEMSKGRFRARVVERSRERESWIRLGLFGMVKLIKNLQDCSRSRLAEPFESVWSEEGRKVRLERHNNRAG